MLSECRALGFEAPDLAFCIDAPEVEYVPLTAPAGRVDDEERKVAGLWERATDALAGRSADTRRLLNALKTVAHRPVDAQRVSFLPLVSSEGDECHLALVPTEQESVGPTLRTLSATDETVEFVGRRLDAEAALLAETAAAHVPSGNDDTTAVVRVGAEDTLLLFLSGSTLQHVDHLRSVTSFDPVETICSRVLLHQDERRIEDIHHVLVVGGPRDGRLVDGFATFYENATIHDLSALLRADVSIAADVERSLTPESSLAIAAALRHLDATAHNLFGKAAQVRRRPRAFAWHTVSVMVLLFAVALFFSWRYMDRQQEVASMEQQLAMSPVPLPELTPAALKQRVDSLNAVHARHNRALHVLDSLLVGSDEWSRAIERTARQTDEIDGLWLDNWSIDASTIKLQGHALDRNNLAAFARNLEGTIQELKFTDIQGVRAYPFVVTIPRQIDMPQVTERLREEALSPESGVVSDAQTP
jgi:Tfp pilus assembly protein PilN